MFSIGYGYNLFHSIGIPRLPNRWHQIKSLKTRVYFGAMCVHYYCSAYMRLHVGHLTKIFQPRIYLPAD